MTLADIEARASTLHAAADREINGDRSLMDDPVRAMRDVTADVLALVTVVKALPRCCESEGLSSTWQRVNPICARIATRFDMNDNDRGMPRPEYFCDLHGQHFEDLPYADAVRALEVG